MSERGEALSVRERETKYVEIFFMFSGFATAICADSISQEVAGFSPLWFPQEKFFVSPCLLCCAYVLLLCMLFS